MLDRFNRRDASSNEFFRLTGVEGLVTAHPLNKFRTCPLSAENFCSYIYEPSSPVTINLHSSKWTSNIVWHNEHAYLNIQAYILFPNLALISTDGSPRIFFRTTIISQHLCRDRESNSRHAELHLLEGPLKDALPTELHSRGKQAQHSVQGTVFLLHSTKIC